MNYELFIVLLFVFKCNKHANYCKNNKHMGMYKFNQKWFKNDKVSVEILDYENSQICQRLYNLSSRTVTKINKWLKMNS